MSISEDKLLVEVVNVSVDGGPPKWWVKVTLRRHGVFFYPSFEDLYRIINGIAHCEDRKYPNGKGRDMVKNVMVESVYNPEWAVIAKRYGIPDRTGGTARDRWNREVAQQLELLDLQMVKSTLEDLQRRRTGTDDDS